jgi:phosphoribosyl 1,2-cyclic phosphodiesterase
MVLSVINSGSEANGYIIQNDSEALILECGCKLSETKKALDWNVRKIVGCLISHEHS